MSNVSHGKQRVGLPQPPGTAGRRAGWLDSSSPRRPPWRTVAGEHPPPLPAETGLPERARPGRLRTRRCGPGPANCARGGTSVVLRSALILLPATSILLPVTPCRLRGASVRCTPRGVQAARAAAGQRAAQWARGSGIRVLPSGFRFLFSALAWLASGLAAAQGPGPASPLTLTLAEVPLPVPEIEGTNKYKPRPELDRR